jgi:hypothetical protein
VQIVNYSYINLSLIGIKLDGQLEIIIIDVTILENLLCLFFKQERERYILQIGSKSLASQLMIGE